MPVFLVNPSDVSFGAAVITPRWLYVLAAATPAAYGDPQVIDGNARADRHVDPCRRATWSVSVSTRAMRCADTSWDAARERGAHVVFGGIHATLFPDEALDHGAAHSVVRGDGDIVWVELLDDCITGRPKRVYEGGRVRRRRFLRRAGICCRAKATCGPRCRRSEGARNTVRSAPCGVPTASSRASARRRGDPGDCRAAPAGFSLHRRWPTITSIRSRWKICGRPRAEGQSRPLDELQAIRDERFDSWSSSKLPQDMVFYTQITMEAAEDPEFLDAMQKAHIRGALVGVESVTPEGLKSSTRISTRRRRARDRPAGIPQAWHPHPGLVYLRAPTDKAETFEATAALAQEPASPSRSSSC